MTNITIWRRVIIAGMSTIALAVGGCMTSNEKAAKYRQPWEEGKFQEAAKEVNKAAYSRVLDKDGGQLVEKPIDKWDRDSVMYLLEQGSILRTIEQIEDSNKAFERADRKMQTVWDRPEFQVSSQVLATMDNLGALPYDGYAYDHVMARTYMALNDLQIGNLPGARERLIASEKSQRDYLENRSKKIEAQKAKLIKDKPEADGISIPTDKDGKSAFGEVDDLVAKYGAYKDYRNPFSTWLYGLFMMSAPADTQDAGSAALAMKLVAGMVPQNKTVQDDVATADSVATGKPLPPTTYVIFETGLAPIRGESVLWIPIPTGNPLRGHLTGMKLAFPKLIVRDGYMPTLAVSAGDTQYQTETLANVDGIVAREFKDELPLVITRTIISGIVKAAITAAAQESTSNGYAKLGVLLASAAYQECTTRADLRQWATLPKEFQVCHFATPADRTVTLHLLSGPFTLKLDEGNVNLVYVKSINAKTPAVVWQRKLN